MPQRPPEIYGIPLKELARICHVTERTARRWKDGTRCPPQSALMLLRGDLACLDPAWAGWTVSRGKLISPEGWTATTGDVLALPLMRMQIHTYQREKQIAKEQLEALVEQPMPGDAPQQIKA